MIAVNATRFVADHGTIHEFEGWAVLNDEEVVVRFFADHRMGDEIAAAIHFTGSARCEVPAYMLGGVLDPREAA